MGKMEEKRAQKRRAILDAAQEIFMAQGYVQTSMDQIAETAQMTKQTLYRYFPGKLDLFEACLRHMREKRGGNFFEALDHPDTEQALYDFAIGFIEVHLTDGHLETYRLLVSESTRAPEIIQSFFEMGPDDTMQTLVTFFSTRLGISEPQPVIRLWTGMLLSFRDRALLGRGKPDQRQIEEHARLAIHYLLAGIKQPR